MGLDIDRKSIQKNKHGFALRISIAVHDCLSVESVCISIAFTIIQSVRSKIKCRDSGIGEENVLFLGYYPSGIGGFSPLVRLAYCYKTIMTYDNIFLVLLMCFQITIISNESW